MQDIRVPHDPWKLAETLGYSSPYHLPAVDAVRVALHLLERNTWEDHKRAVEVLRQCSDRTVGKEGR